ncbi:Rid family hydrolase [Paenalcaligenes niemegkensis]|uniref:RidA family protein n=1 Tax=Paenalcaligenes niemegkensis TaxID=2895469 RepID=UPI001EE979E3|nr:Rid family hydrolase [Paenalcaligenes niemegkensis]MCQ9617504.1 Rid family hydrolase [Paenalcaligenes niemegkensis]
MSEIRRYTGSTPLPFSRATEAGGFLFLSGQLPLDATGAIVKGDIAAQTNAVFDRIEESLKASSASLEQVVKATVWLSDLNEFAEFNEVYSKRFAGSFPTRSLVESKLVYGVGVEIEVQAWVGQR